jgi:hypothetical protein
MVIGKLEWEKSEEAWIARLCGYSGAKIRNYSPWLVLNG